MATLTPPLPKSISIQSRSNERRREDFAIECLHALLIRGTLMTEATARAVQLADELISELEAKE